MTARLRCAVLAACLVAGGRQPASAQTIEPLRGRFEMAVGGQWLGGSSLGSKEADLTTGAGIPFGLFKTSSSLTGAGGIEARIGYRLRKRLDVEGFGGFAKPAVETAITNDIENAPNTTASDTLKQFVVGGSAVWYLSNRLQSPRVRPFIIGSAAYVRQLHDADTLAVTGSLFEGGGGIKYLLSSSQAGRLASVGLRADARLQVRVNGVTFNGDVHYQPVLTASLFMRFQKPRRDP